MALIQYLTVNEAAERLGVTRVTLWRWRKEGMIRAEVPPGSTVQHIPNQEVQRIQSLPRDWRGVIFPENE